jgi:hypothetical protein
MFGSECKARLVVEELRDLLKRVFRLGYLNRQVDKNKIGNRNSAIFSLSLFHRRKDRRRIVRDPDGYS